MASAATNRLIGPVLAGASALLAAAVWLVPGRVLSPEPAPAADEGPRAPVKPAYEPPKKESRWPELASKLNDLREPWKGPDPVATTDGQAPITPPEVTLAWEYVGYIQSTRLRSAMVVINNQQRFVSEGEVVPDPSLPGARLRVKSIRAEELKVAHESASGGGGPPAGGPTGGAAGGAHQGGEERISTIKRKPVPAPTIVADGTHREPAGGGAGGPGGPGGPGGMPIVPGLHSSGGKGMVPPMPGQNPPVPFSPGGTPMNPKQMRPDMKPDFPGKAFPGSSPGVQPARPTATAPTPAPVPAPTPVPVAPGGKPGEARRP